MIFEVGQHFMVKANTKIWCISLQHTIRLDTDLVCELTGWGYKEDILFGYAVEYGLCWHITNTRFEMSIGVDKVKPVKFESYFDGYYMQEKLIYL